jgi:hypothetical protein
MHGNWRCAVPGRNREAHAHHAALDAFGEGPGADVGTTTDDRHEVDSTPRPRRWRRVVALVMGGLVGLVLLAGVAVLLFEEQLVMVAGGASGLPVRPDPELQTAIETTFDEAEGDDVVVLSDVTDFDWDAVGVFHPYYSHDEVVDEMGVRVPRGVTNITQLESYCLLVFGAEDRMVAWTSVSRNVAECSADGGTGVHPADEARFGADTFRPAARN